MYRTQSVIIEFLKIINQMLFRPQQSLSFALKSVGQNNAKIVNAIFKQGSCELQGYEPTQLEALSCMPITDLEQKKDCSLS